MRANIACGHKPMDRWVVLTSPLTLAIPRSSEEILGIYAQNCISLFESTENKVSQIEATRPDVLDGYSGSLFLLAKELKRRGLKTIKPLIWFLGTLS